MMAGTVMPPPGGATAAAAAGLRVGVGEQMVPASVANSFRVMAVMERLAWHMQPGIDSNSSEFFNLCLSLARGIDYAVANNETLTRAQDLPLLLRQVCQRKNDHFLQAAIMALMISVKNACKIGWFQGKEAQELLTLATEIGNTFCRIGDISTVTSNSDSIISTVMSRFYPLMKMGQILTSLEAKPGYGAYVIDFHIAKNTGNSLQEKIRLFVAQADNIETSACIINPQQVNFLLNGRGVERRTNVLMDPGPQLPTNVTAMLKYGTNLLQAVGQFNGHYIIAIAFMSVTPCPDAPVLQDYVQFCVAESDPDSDIIEGPSRISLNCPISYTRIRTPIKGHSCKHLQCFDFGNFLDINTRRPSWRCPHCNQHISYPDIRVDQNMVKVLREVGDNVTDVIISADGSWKAVLESDDIVDQMTESTLNCQKEKSEQRESSTSSSPIVDLTSTDDGMDTVGISDIEDRKPSLVNHQSQCVANNLTVSSQLNNVNSVNQNIAAPIEDDFWSSIYFSQEPLASSLGSDVQMVDGILESTPANSMTSPVMTDANAISPALNHDVGGRGNTNLTSVMQRQFAASNLQLQQSQFVNSVVNNEYERLQQIPRHVSRTPMAVQALPAPSQTPPLQHRSRTNLSAVIPSVTSIGSQAALTVSPTASGLNTVSSNMDRQQQFSRPHNIASSSLQHHSTVQSLIHQDRSFAPGQSVHQQVVGRPTSSQLPGGAYSVSSGLPGESQNLHQQQALRMAQSRSQSPSLNRSSSPILRTPIQPGGAQVGVANTPILPNNQHSRFMPASQRATLMTRQPPSVPVQIQTSRAASTYPMNADVIRVQASEQRANAGAVQTAAGTDSVVDVPSEQNWRPTGRMRGSLSGQAYSDALKEFMIQPTQPQVPRPPSNFTPPSVSAPPHLQALRMNRQNAHVPLPQNTSMTEPATTNSSSGILP